MYIRVCVCVSVHGSPLMCGRAVRVGTEDCIRTKLVVKARPSLQLEREAGENCFFLNAAHTSRRFGNRLIEVRTPETIPTVVAFSRARQLIYTSSRHRNGLRVGSRVRGRG